MQPAPEMHKMRNMQGEVGLVDQILARESGASSSSVKVIMIIISLFILFIIYFYVYDFA